MKILFFIFLVGASSFVYSQSAEELFITSDSARIYGTLLYPPKTDKMPVVLIIAGSGPTDRNGNSPGATNNSLKMLAEALADSGIASLRYDKRGIAASASSNISEINTRFDDFVADAARWVKLLHEDKRFERIIILGHSEGSLIGMRAAQGSSANKFISVAGTGRKANEILLEQIAKNSPFFTVPATITLDSLASGYTVKNILPALQGIFRPQIQPYLISWFKYDPKVEIKKLNIPVLIVQGTTDIQVPLSDAELLAEARPKAELEIIEGMNHILKKAPADKSENLKTYSNAQLPLMDGLIEPIIEFILK